MKVSAVKYLHRNKGESSISIQSHTVAFWTFTFHKKTRLCVADLADQFQMCLEAKLINFLIRKFRSVILIFLLFFAGVVKSSAFCTLLLLFQRVEVLKLQYDKKTWLKHFNLFGIALTVSKKYWIWQFLKKEERKISVIYLNFQIEKLITLACRLAWNWPSKLTTRSPGFCEM